MTDAIAELTRLYRSPAAHELYDEAVTELAHALQCAELAAAAGADDALVVAALAHDVGHLLTARPDDTTHELVGADFLARWFPPAVVGPVALHVDAKRYLCATDATYHATLSPASVASLVGQGGPMDDAERAAFEAAPHAEAAVRLRRWDDDAKVADLPTRDLEAFVPLIERVLGE
ncbi:MAG: HD domain-containing protein [Actinomycetota bacterium]|nr:HD domain-containing protein [Actinomycetota bacterium]